LNVKNITDPSQPSFHQEDNMNNWLYPKFLAGFSTSLILYSLFISPVLINSTPFTGQAKAAVSAPLFQFIPSGQNPGFTADGMVTASGSDALEEIFMGKVDSKNGLRPGMGTAGFGGVNSGRLFSVNPAPGAFGKSSPVDGATDQPTNPTLRWGASSGANSYEVCFDTSDDDTCTGEWISGLLGTNLSISGLTTGVTYFWQVRAINALGTTYADGIDAWWSFTVPLPPGAFETTAPVDGTTTQETPQRLRWGTSSFATSYEYCIDTSDDDICNNSWISIGASTSKTIYMSPNTYYWQVRAINATSTTYANGSSSAWRSFIVIRPPQYFSKISPVDGGTNQTANITLSWEYSQFVSSYEICIDVSDDDICNSSWISTGTSTSKTINVGSNTYYWQVRAINAYGTTWANYNSNSWWSFVVVQPPDLFNKTNPSDGATFESTTGNLSWEASNLATSYEYCIDDVDDDICNSTWISNGTRTNKAVIGLSPGIHFWQVRAVNGMGTTYANGNRDTNTWWSFTVVPMPGNFNKSSPIDGATNQPSMLRLKWGASSNATSYEVCIDRTDDNACSTSWVPNGKQTGKSYYSLDGGTYFWQVRSINITGTTYADASSNAWLSFTVTPKPGDFNKSSPTDGVTSSWVDQTVRWGTSSDSTSYQYCIDTTNDNACSSSWISTGTSTRKSLSGLSAGTHYWQVRAKNVSGVTYANGSGSDWWSIEINAPPGPFEKSSPVDLSTNLPSNPTLTWGTSSSASSYEYCIDKIDDDICNSSWVSGGSSTSKVLNNLTQGTHYWQVRAVNAKGTTYANGSSSDWWAFTVDLRLGNFQKASPPDGTASQFTKLMLTWTTSSNATAYEYCIDTSDDDACSSSWTPMGTGTREALSGLSAGTYYWQVRATNATETTYADGSSSNWRSFTILPVGPVVAGEFEKSSPVDGATNQPNNPTLRWGTSSETTSYEYCIDTSDDDACSASWISSGTSTSVALSGLIPGEQYFWQVRANHATGSSYSGGVGAWWSFTINPAPGAFVKTSPVDSALLDQPSATLTWGESSNANSYEVCIDTSDDTTCNESWISNGISTSYVLSDLAPGYKYYWQVRAINDDGTTYANGSESAWWTFMISPDVPPQVLPPSSGPGIAPPPSP
jgi:hypothetical protein